MLGYARTFEARDYPDLGSEAECRPPSGAHPGLKARARVATMAAIGRRIEAKILILHRAVRRWHREAAFMVGQSVDAVRCHLARARDQLRAAVYRRGESTWTRPAAARPQDQPVSELVQ